MQYRVQLTRYALFNGQTREEQYTYPCQLLGTGHPMQAMHCSCLLICLLSQQIVGFAVAVRYVVSLLFIESQDLTPQLQVASCLRCVSQLRRVGFSHVFKLQGGTIYCVSSKKGLLEESPRAWCRDQVVA
jgi:hypothetical protein